jgi:hypothetical protein
VRYLNWPFDDHRIHDPGRQIRVMSQMNRRDILDVIRDLTIKNWAPYFILGRNIETVTVEA